MRHGSLFSGGGGFDLAAEIMGWENVFHCEIDPFCKRILQHYWPEAQSFDDIRKFNGKPFKGKIDVLTGGFPCQPFSVAGRRTGTKDDRYLWPEMLRVIGTIMPTWVIAENVYGIVNWNEGLVFDTVHADLEGSGYEVQTFVLPAAGVNAPHRRYRVWFVGCKIAANRHSAGLEGSARPTHSTKGRKIGNKQLARLRSGVDWKGWSAQSPLRCMDDGVSGTLDGISVSRWLKESIRMYGNAIVPQVALQIFKAIEMTEMHHKS